MTYRKLMGSWTTGVSLITSQGPQGLSGCTMNSLTSLSLRPPLVIVCFDEAARTLEAVRWSRRFAINILAADQEPVSRRFATKASQEEKFKDITVEFEHEAPVLAGCMAYIICEIEDEITGGDHVIVVSRPLIGTMNEDAAPLVFHGGKYWTALPHSGQREVGAEAEDLPPEFVGWDVEELAEALSVAALRAHGG